MEDTLRVDCGRAAEKSASERLQQGERRRDRPALDLLAQRLADQPFHRQIRTTIVEQAGAVENGHVRLTHPRERVGFALQAHGYAWIAGVADFERHRCSVDIPRCLPDRTEAARSEQARDGKAGYHGRRGRRACFSQRIGADSAILRAPTPGGESSVTGQAAGHPDDCAASSPTIGKSRGATAFPSSRKRITMCVTGASPALWPPLARSAPTPHRAPANR